MIKFLKKLFFIVIIASISFFAGKYFYEEQEIIEAENNVESLVVGSETEKYNFNSIYNPERKTETDKLFKSEFTTDVEVKAKQLILIDASTGVILLEKNANQEMSPSSMTKMMTSYLVEEKILKGQIKSTDSFVVSKKAWRKQGSKMFVPLGKKVNVMDLLKGVIIVSGNDASIVLAEGISGSEKMFVREMNEMAQKFGLNNTHFKNSSGWPEPGHVTTARDLALLGIRVVYDHPDFYKIYSEKKFTFGKSPKGQDIVQGNRNPLLYQENLGCDGIKTGHTDDGGYGMVASFVDGEQRYLMVINGLPSMQDRADEAKKLLSWAKKNFMVKPIYEKNQVIEAKAPIKFGKQKSVPVFFSKNVDMLLPRLASDQITTEIVLPTLTAPVIKGAQVGKAIIYSPVASEEVLLLAAETVEKLGWIKKIARIIYTKIFSDDKAQNS